MLFRSDRFARSAVFVCGSQRTCLDTTRLNIPKLFFLGSLAVAGGSAAFAQVDPDKRQLVEFGFNQAFQGSAPIAAYAYYYANLPDWPRDGQTLRVAVAPVYLDAELAFREALGPQTHLAFGLAGGAFADSYSEVRAGKYLKEESDRKSTRLNSSHT